MTTETLDVGRSAALLARARRVIPGGVNTARRKIHPPLCLRRGRGAYVEDYDGNRYLDFHAAYGPILLGYSYPVVSEAVHTILDDQVLFGVGVTELEVAVAEKVVTHVPSAEQAVMCGSGSEATYHAIRLARAATGRPLLLKFQGEYHGYHDYVLRNVMSRPDMIGKRDPMSAGMLDAAVDATLVCPINDLTAVQETFARFGHRIAAVIIEPIAHNAPSILPVDGFLDGLRWLCTDYGALLIFDEVITGFRHHIGGYQSLCGVTPDLTTFAKAIANGYPVAAVAGRRELLEQFNTTPTGNVTFAGTYNGGAIGMAAALATLQVLETEPVYDHIFGLGDQMRAGLRAIADELGVPAVVSGYGSLYAILFMEEGPLLRYDDVLRNDDDFAIDYLTRLRELGVFQMPESIGRNHISYSHTNADIDFALDMSRKALRATVAARGLPTTASRR